MADSIICWITGDSFVVKPDPGFRKSQIPCLDTIIPSSITKDSAI